MIVGPTPKELGEAGRGARLAGILPDLEFEINKFALEVENRVFAAIQTGEFNAQMAESAWMEMYAFKRLLRRFKTHVTMGVSTGEKIAPQMKLGE